MNGLAFHRWGSFKHNKLNWLIATALVTGNLKKQKLGIR